MSYEADSRGRFTSCLSCGAEVQIDQHGNPIAPMGYADGDRGGRPGGSHYGKLWREPKQGRKR